MKFTVTEPETGIPLEMEAKPERLIGEQGYRITCANGSSFFICSKLGTWRVLDNHHIDPELLEEIGLALEEYPHHEDTGAPTMPHDNKE